MSGQRDEFVAQFGRSVNLAGVFDRRDGERGWTLRPRHLDSIAAVGFDGVRLPVRWWGHSAAAAPYSIDERFVAEVGEIVDAVIARGLAIVLTMHHADAVNDDPVDSSSRLAALWRQVAERFHAHRSVLAFELLNEPRMAPTAWNTLLIDALREVRAIDPHRVVVAGGAAASTVDGLLALDMPDDDPNLVATVHYYEPFHFTHQGAFWEPGSDAWLGTRWGTPAEHQAVQVDLRAAASWARDRDLPLLVGEFGALSLADAASRTAWTASVRRAAEQLGLMWGYWDFATDFGLYDLDTETWRADLLESLFG